MGAGGKTTVLRRLACEAAAVGRSVIMTTTTHMRAIELGGQTAIVLERDDDALTERLRAALKECPLVAAARTSCGDGKVDGLTSNTVDGLWRAGLADLVLVEADGSRRRSFKAFGSGEPELPGEATTIVQVAGLDAIGRPLADENVHRPEVLAQALMVTLGSEVTADVFVDGLRLQMRRLRRSSGSRVVTLLNKADACEREDLGADVARALLAPGRRERDAAVGGADDRPDAVIVGSLRQGVYECIGHCAVNAPWS